MQKKTALNGIKSPPKVGFLSFPINLILEPNSGGEFRDGSIPAPELQDAAEADEALRRLGRVGDDRSYSGPTRPLHRVQSNLLLGQTSKVNKEKLPILLNVEVFGFMYSNTPSLFSCEVRWSPRMTQCAGICRYSPRERFCTIGTKPYCLTCRILWLKQACRSPERLYNVYLPRYSYLQMYKN